jgi:hypothetical protein
VVGTGVPRQKASRSALLAKQLTGVLPPEPRGSQPTMSNRPPVMASSAPPCSVTAATPESPGPPGLTNNEPIR